MKVKCGGIISYRGSYQKELYDFYLPEKEVAVNNGLSRTTYFDISLHNPPRLAFPNTASLVIDRHFEDKGHWWTFAKKREVRRWVLTLITGLTFAHCYSCSLGHSLHEIVLSNLRSTIVREGEQFFSSCITPQQDLRVHAD